MENTPISCLLYRLMHTAASCSMRARKGVTHMREGELIVELEKRAEKTLYAAGSVKGLPEDKHYEEIDVAHIVLEHVRRPVASVMSEPHGPDTAPDVGIVLQSGERIGLEVTELVDGDLRGQHVGRHIAEDLYRVWNETEIAMKLDALIQRKDTNIHLRDNASSYDAVWLAVFSGEQHINYFADLVQKAAAHVSYHPTLINRVFVVLDYVPGRSDSGYPVIEI
jgi:hypothetical protein